jgi:hypothetical protein
MGRQGVGEVSVALGARKSASGTEPNVAFWRIPVLIVAASFRTETDFANRRAGLVRNRFCGDVASRDGVYPLGVRPMIRATSARTRSGRGHVEAEQPADRVP